MTRLVHARLALLVALASAALACSGGDDDAAPATKHGSAAHDAGRHAPAARDASIAGAEADSGIDHGGAADADAAARDAGHAPRPAAIVRACGAPGARLRLAATAELPGRGMALAFSPDGGQIVAGGRFLAGNNGSRYDARVYDAASGAFVKSFGCPVYWTSAVAWAQVPGLGSVIAGGNYGHQVFLWDTSGAGTTRCTSLPHFEPGEGAIHGLPQIDGAVTWLAFSPDRRWLAAANRDPSLRVWALETGVNQYRAIKLWSENASANYTSVAWAPNAPLLALSERSGSKAGRVFVLGFDRASNAWNQATIDDFAKQSYSAQAGWAKANAAQVAVEPVWSDEGRSFWGVSFSPDGTRVAAAAEDGSLSVYDAASGALRYRVQADANGSLTTLAYSPDGALIAAGGSGKQIWIFDAATGDVRDTLAGHTAPLTAISWSPDACSLATTAGGPRICGADCHRCTGAPDRTPMCPEYADLSVRIWTFAR